MKLRYTVSSTTAKISFSGDGSTTVFPISFVFLSSSNLVVTLVNTTTGAVTTWALTTNYTVSGGANSDGTPNTGTLTAVTAPASGYTLVIRRVVPYTQPDQYAANDPFPAKVVEAAFDRATMETQQVVDNLTRCLQIPTGDTSGTTVTLTSSVGRAGKYLVFDSSGNASVTGNVGNWRGTWATATTYYKNDIIQDGAAGANTLNIYVCTVDHTSGTWATDLAVPDWSLAINYAAVTAAAAASATAAAASATAAASSATAAASSASAASTSASAASTSASAASTSATSAASSASTASTSATAAASSATAAAASATAAASSATAAAASAATLYGTSTTSLTPAVASKTFTTQSGKSWGVGAYLMIASAAAPTVYMFGQVTSYSGTTLIVDVQAIGTASAAADWNIWLAGARGATGATGATGAAGSNGVATPQGRLTLATATPVMITAQTGKTVVYYALDTGNQIPIYDGVSAYALTTFAELTNDLTASSTGKAGPAAATTNSNYDLFVWSDSGTIRLSRGPLWTSDTARGTGAGTTELQRVLGIWTNKVAITNGPGAGLGTYVGTIRTDGSSQANWNPTPAAASGGAEAKLHVFNAYNRVPLHGASLDNVASWTYGTATWRSLDNSTSNRVSYIDGLGELTVDAHLTIGVNQGSGGLIHFGINRDSTSATPPFATLSQIGATNGTSNARGLFTPLLGYHYLQPMEAAGSGASTTMYGNGTVGMANQFETFTAEMTL